LPKGPITHPELAEGTDYHFARCKQKYQKQINMTNMEELTGNTDVQGQKIPPVFIKTEEINTKQDKQDYSKVYILPSLRTRYVSMIIDVLIIVLIALGATQLFEIIGIVPNWIRAATFIFVFLLYEPILVSVGCTVGQLLLNIRVRRFKDPTIKLLFPMALIRFLVKAFLGWLSFVTIIFNVNRQAIHDLASGSIMISCKIEDKS
jgi:uncharacterized RDD family membrane protein YckC